MKKLIILITLISATAGYSQTNSFLQNLGNFFEPIIKATNWDIGGYGLYDTSTHNYGGGVGALFNIQRPTTNNPVGIGSWLRTEYDGKSFNFGSGSIQLSLSQQISIFNIPLTTEEFAYTGIGLTWAQLKSNNGSPEGIVGAGLAIKISSKFNVFGCYEKRTLEGDKILGGVMYSF